MCANGSAWILGDPGESSHRIYRWDATKKGWRVVGSAIRIAIEPDGTAWHLNK